MVHTPCLLHSTIQQVPTGGGPEADSPGETAEGGGGGQEEGEGGRGGWPERQAHPQRPASGAEEEGGAERAGSQEEEVQEQEQEQGEGGEEEGGEERTSAPLVQQYSTISSSHTKTPTLKFTLLYSCILLYTV